MLQELPHLSIIEKYNYKHKQGSYFHAFRSYNIFNRAYFSIIA